MTKTARRGVVSWDARRDGELSEESLRRRYPAPSFRLAVRRFTAGELVRGAMRKGTCFVLRGECKFMFDDQPITLKSGEYSDLPEGEFAVLALGTEDLVYVVVWPVPSNTTG